MTIIDTQSHLGDYGNAIEEVPGIKAYFGEKINKTGSSSSSDGSSLLIPLLALGVVGAVFIVIRTRTSKSEPLDMDDSPKEEEQ